MPGPITTAPSRLSVSSAAASSSLRRISASAGIGPPSPASVTSPAPVRSAARPARPDAPPWPGVPSTTITQPRAYLCASRPGPSNCGRAVKASGLSMAMPISTTASRPVTKAPSPNTCPGLAAPKLSVSSAGSTRPSALPVSASNPETMSMATTRPTPCKRSSAAWALSGSGRVRPVPNSASTINGAAGASLSGTTGPVQRRAMVAAGSDVGGASAATVTATPASSSRQAMP